MSAALSNTFDLHDDGADRDPSRGVAREAQRVDLWSGSSDAQPQRTARRGGGVADGAAATGTGRTAHTYKLYRFDRLQSRVICDLTSFGRCRLRFHIFVHS